MFDGEAVQEKLHISKVFKITFSSYPDKELTSLLPASGAQLDAHPTGEQDVAGSISADSGNIHSWRLIMKYFLRPFSSFRIELHPPLYH